MFGMQNYREIFRTQNESDLYYTVKPFKAKVSYCHISDQKVDRTVNASNKHFFMVGALDGCGPKGNIACAHLQNFIDAYMEMKVDASNPEKFVKLFMDSLALGFEMLEDSKDSGVCCIFLFVFEKKYYVANVGNCKAYVVKEYKNGFCEAVCLNR
jgi:serine/threonine protein phosphatase PrpC